MHVILIPGLWLVGSSWDAVIPHLEKAGHQTHPLTLPGMESKTTDRSKVSLQDHIDTVTRAIDDLDPADGKVALVGHSMGGGLAHAAADARPDRIARVVYLASEPRGEGKADGAGFPTSNGEMPLPEWSFFDDEMVADLDDDLRATIREAAVPSPERVATDYFHLSDERRLDVPATLITCEYSAEQLKEWTAQNAPGTEELGKLRNVEYVDLGGGHWPQYSRPVEAAAVIVKALG